jgi:hypothetical protein
MSLILDGTNGVSDIDGTAATPAIRGTDANTGIFFPAADTIAFSEDGTEAMRIDSSGNMGLGTTSPSVRLHVSTSGAGVQDVQWLNNSQAVGTNVGSRLVFTGTSSNNGLAAIDGAFAGATTADGGYMAFNTRAVTSGALTERMRIDSSGKVLIGTTSQIQGGLLSVKGAANYDGVVVIDNGTTTGGGILRICQNGVVSGIFATTGSQLGTTGRDIAIVAETGLGIYTYTNGGTAGPYVASGGTSWTNSSDERLKNITNNISNALDKVNQLRAVEFTWKNDDTNKPQVGLIAQDVEKVLPQAVNKSALNKGDLTEYLGVQYTDIIPLLVASIKELKATVDAQAARIAALEAAV